jgi:hypothetical protein
MKYLDCKSVSIIEWYDGVVQGLIEADTGLWYAALQAFDASHRKRLYVIVQIPPGGARVTNVTTGTLLPISISDLEALFKGNDIFITFDEPAKGSRIDLRRVKKPERQHINVGEFQIENAVSDDAIQFWLYQNSADSV